MVVDRTDRIAVVGAGSSGLAAAKNLREHGFEVDVFERNDDVGGNWYFDTPRSRVYASTHTISSKPFTQFPDFPMPDEWPDYPHHTHLRTYFQRYAAHFGLYEHTRFETSVVSIEPHDGGAAWDVTVAPADEDGPTETCRFGAVVIANGHNWFPKRPAYPGQDRFTGEIVHAADYRSADQLRGRRVLVVGAGNTGCDIVVEAAQQAEAAFHSTRRAYWYAPKYTFGRPSDQIADRIFALNLPARLNQALFEATARLTVGRYERFGLPTPDHRFLETHPIVNQELLFHIGHGEITPKPDVERFAGDHVAFVDGTTERVDLVVYATGYLIRFPFIDHELLNWRGDPGYPLLYRHVFHPEFPNLFVVGLIQPDSGQFKLVHWQSVAVARYLRAQRDDPATAAAFAREIREHVSERSTGGVRFLESTRHYVEVEHLDYLRDLRDTIAHLS